MLYVWLAPAVLEDRGAASSVDGGLRAIKSRKVLFGFIVPYFIVLTVMSLLNEQTGQPMVGVLTTTGTTLAWISHMMDVYCLHCGI